jgi:hypothetical protein
MGMFDTTSLVYRIARLNIGERVEFFEMNCPLHIQRIEEAVYLVELQDVTAPRPPIVCSATALHRILDYLLQSCTAKDHRSHQDGS